MGYDQMKEDCLVHEFELIQTIRSRQREYPWVKLGIGDDAALISTPEDTLVAVDLLMEGVHFDFSEVTPAQVGRKALAVNLSDIAAMGGSPHSAVVSVALPKSRGGDFALEVQQGLQALAEEYQVALIGGDTNTWDGPFVISVTVLGAPIRDRAIPRSGARVGDWICVTGELGGSRQGKHVLFTPRLQEARILTEQFEIHSMIDLSDGLASDLRHILRESRLGALIELAQIPVSEHIVHLPKAWEHALGDGEDFELLFTVSPQVGEVLIKSPPFITQITKIGEIVAGSGARLIYPSGYISDLPKLGWKHVF